MSELRDQLREQQRAFAAHVFDGEEISTKYLTLKDSEGAQFSDAQRFQIYHNNIVISLREALSGIYPVINKLVGDEFFQHVAREYIGKHPSVSGNIHVFGESFPEFLEAFPGLDDLAYLSDVARLEWAYHRVFHSGEDGVLNVQKLAALDEDSNSHLRFQVSNSCCLLSSAYPVLKIWQANQEAAEEQVIDLDEGGVRLIVQRTGSKITFNPLNIETFTLLHHLSIGHLFVDACEEALAVAPQCDVGSILQYLIKQRLLTGFESS